MQEQKSLGVICRARKWRTGKCRTGKWRTWTIKEHLRIELLIPGKFISREGNKFPGTGSGLDRVSIVSTANR